MRTRTRDGRVSVSTEARRKSEGRRAPLAIASQPRAGRSLRGALSHLLALLTRRTTAEQRAAVEQSESAAEELRKARRAVVLHASRLRADGHRAPVNAFLAAVTSDGGRMLRLYADAHPDFREAMHRAVMTFADVIVEHEVESTAATEMLARAALHGALSEALDSRIVREGINTSTAGLAKVAAAEGREARLDLLSGLAIAREARTLSADREPPIDIVAAVRAVSERHEREAASDDDKRGDES